MTYRGFFLSKDGKDLIALKRTAITPRHAEALTVCLIEEGINYFNAEGKIIGHIPVLPGDTIQFFPVAQG